MKQIVVFGLLLASVASASANGLTTVAPAPVKTITTTVNIKPSNFIKQYKAIRAFWLSRALVR